MDDVEKALEIVAMVAGGLAGLLKLIHWLKG